MVHPAAIVATIGMGLGFLLFLWNYGNTEQPHQHQRPHPDPYEHFRYDPANSTECSICLYDVNEEEYDELECGHRFHRKCWNNYLKHEEAARRTLVICPNCRKPAKVRTRGDRR